jgi:hypothetical protein
MATHGTFTSITQVARLHFALGLAACCIFATGARAVLVTHDAAEPMPRLAMKLPAIFDSVERPARLGAVFATMAWQNSSSFEGNEYVKSTLTRRPGNSSTRGNFAFDDATGRIPEPTKIALALLGLGCGAVVIVMRCLQLRRKQFQQEMLW